MIYVKLRGLDGCRDARLASAATCKPLRAGARNETAMQTICAGDRGQRR